MSDNAYWQDIVTRISCCRCVELITISIVTIPSIWNNSAANFYVLENFHRKFPNLVAPPTERTAKCLVRCKVDPVL